MFARIGLLIVGVAVILTALLLITVPRNGSASKESQQLGFPFYVKLERRFDSIGPPLQMATIILSKEHFSRENLERLFLWYSENHPNRQERLTVQVFTDPKKIQPSGIVIGYNNTPATEKESTERATLADATFFRTLPSASSHNAGENEFFVYDPTMSGSGGQRRVVLKGIDSFAIKRNLEVWGPQGKNDTLRISAYELPTVEPSRIYYSLESRESNSEWETIMTSQQDGALRIPRDQLRFLNNRIAYAFIGSLFAVTLDGGVEWTVWDSERDIPCNDRWAKSVITEVLMQETGNGIMKVSFLGQSRSLDLATTDFGAHWNCN